VTLEEAAGAFVTGVAGGVVVGFLLGRSDFWARVFSPYIQVLNALPRLIFAPILILLLGLDERSKIALGFSLVFFIVFFNAFQGGARLPAAGRVRRDGLVAAAGGLERTAREDVAQDGRRRPVADHLPAGDACRPARLLQGRGHQRRDRRPEGRVGRAQGAAGR